MCLLRTWQLTMATIYSHFTVICSKRFNKRMELRTHEQPHVAEHEGRIKKHQNDRSHTRRTHKVPFMAACSHFTLYTEKHTVSCSGFLPNKSPVQHSCSTLRQMYCCVMCCCVMSCYVMYWCVMYCFVMYFYVMYCCVMYCYVMYYCIVV